MCFITPTRLPFSWLLFVMFDKSNRLSFTFVIDPVRCPILHEFSLFWWIPRFYWLAFLNFKSYNFTSKNLFISIISDLTPLYWLSINSLFDILRFDFSPNNDVLKDWILLRKLYRSFSDNLCKTSIWRAKSLIDSVILSARRSMMFINSILVKINWLKLKLKAKIINGWVGKRVKDDKLNKDL